MAKEREKHSWQIIHEDSLRGLTFGKGKGVLEKTKVFWCYKCGMIKHGPFAEQANYYFHYFYKTGIPGGIEAGKDGTEERDPLCIPIKV